MRTIKRLGLESLERREVFSVVSGLEGVAGSSFVLDEVLDGDNYGIAAGEQLKSRFHGVTVANNFEELLGERSNPGQETWAANVDKYINTDELWV